MAATPDFTLDIDSIADRLPSAVYQRGLGIFQNQQVVSCATTRAEGTWLVQGQVSGGGAARPYDTSVAMEVDDNGRVRAFRSTCSCPGGTDCRHAVALALQAASGADLAAAAVEEEPEEEDEAPQAAGNSWVDMSWLGSRAAPDAAAARQGQDLLVFLLHLPRPRKPGAGGLPPRPTLSWGLSRPRRTGATGWTRVKTPVHYGGPPTRDATADEQECVRLIAALGSRGYGRNSAEGPIDGPSGLLALQLAAQGGRLFVADEQQIAGEALSWGPARSVQWRWSETTRPSDPEPTWALEPFLNEGEGRILPGQPTLYVDAAAGLCGEATVAGVDAEHFGALFGAAAIAQSALGAPQTAELARLAGLALPAAVPPAERVEGVVPVPHLHIAPVPLAERARLGPLRAALTFDYAGLRRWWPHRQARVLDTHDGRRLLLQRDLAAEADIAATLERFGLVGDKDGRYHLPPPAGSAVSPWLDWASHGYEPLRAAGFGVTADPALQGFIRSAAALDVRLTGSDGQPLAGDGELGDSRWFGLSLGIEIDGVRENILPWLPELLAQLQATAEGAALPQWIWRQRGDGGFVRIPSAPLAPWLAALLDLVGERGGDFDGDRLHLSRMEALRLGAALGADVPWAGAAGLRALLASLGGQEQLPVVPLPAGLKAELRPYQHRGFDWLQFLRVHGLAGILADDMGLGKTLQTLAHILAEKESGRADRPSLVVAPVSLLGNWQREAARFAPGLRTHVWHGTGRHEEAERIARSDLVIVPYSLLQRDRALWLGQPWHLVVLDEAQHIKNATSNAAQVASELDARHRLCLSGTPLENHLGELWSLFHFLMPGFLGSQGRFKSLFRNPIEKFGDPDRLGQLRRRVTPFLLRRTKAAVASELPAKVENVTSVALSGAQADLYETIRLATEKSVREALREKGLARSQILVLDALLKLRQVCCDPRLVASVPAAQRVKESAKLELLMEVLPAMLAEGRRVLLFSQFTSMLALVEEELKARNLRWAKLTGQTGNRDAVIDRFTNGEVPLFLISLKAGGTGLNLPQADTVIHYDPWWNPAAEDQATGRAHRIGQKNKVFVYKLVAQGTIEERILALQARKAELADTLYRGAAARREALFTEEDVAELLRPLE
ncbi:DEAD/DEAH box helicase [Xylophilus sp.]|uniref:DEAD/DEAH box helicase n=1 Tax=Xylophilus sp. TaxID=2653893 RepID=UPI0013B6F2C2|nr:DEAD/DEAH box helicase [Xylophilus sp.]KAF1048194.1 MAG: RNA polymerase-associated protein RapA [Xylophilus sp.]